jgi:hypothetical protein
MVVEDPPAELLDVVDIVDCERAIEEQFEASAYRGG